jgi:hypothetical protein
MIALPAIGLISLLGNLHHMFTFLPFVHRIEIESRTA